MHKVDVNKKRNDPDAQIDLQTFWREVSDIKAEKVVNFTGDWDENYGKMYPRFQDKENDTIIPLGRLEDGRYGVFNLSIDLNLLAVGSALSGLGVFRRATLAHLTQSRTPEQLQIVVIDPIRALADFDDVPHLAIPRAVSKEHIENSLRWIRKEYERRMKVCDDGYNLVYIHNEKSAKKEKQPKLLILISELGELDLGNSEINKILTMVMQMSRAIEVNTILCTQQFSETRLPNEILSNTPAKIAFRLPYKEDSKRIIGKAGAEELLGQGDMLFTYRGDDWWRMQGFHY